MAGLLYKDFVSVGGKKIVMLFSFLTILYIALRLIFPGTTDMELFLLHNEDGEMIHMMDVFFLFACGLFLVAECSILNGWIGKTVEGDDKNKIQGYLCALPLEKNDYIASKYVFIGISVYIFLSLSICWSITANAFCRDGMLADAFTMLASALPVIACIILLSAAVEFPLFLTVGKSKALLIKTAIWLTLAYVVVGLLFFADMGWVFEHLSITRFMDWYKNNQFFVALMNILFPVVSLVLYYFSYRITCFLVIRQRQHTGE
ncbi:MAG: ABC-2 transporter permease [Lachnospiraceae bacterium]